MPGFTVLIGIDRLLRAVPVCSTRALGRMRGWEMGLLWLLLDGILLAWAPQPLTLCGLPPGVPHPTAGEAAAPRQPQL